MDFAPWVSALFLLVVGTAFVKIATVLNALRIGIGFTGTGLGVATTLLSFVLSLALLGAHEGGSELTTQMIEAPGSVTAEAALNVTRKFVEKHTDPKIRENLATISRPKTAAETAPSMSWPAEYAAFMISELRQAFLLACAILIPFLVIDLVVGHFLALLGVQHLPAPVVSFPVKMLLFVAVDGWSLLVAKIIAGY